MSNITLSDGSEVLKPEVYVYNILASYISVVGVCGSLENLCVIIVFLRCKSLWSPSNIYILDLACSDMLISMVGFPFLATSGFKYQWMFASVGCSAYGFFMSIVGLHSIFIMVVIATERYRAISEPIRMVKTFARKRSLIFVVITWLIAIGSSLPPLLGWNKYVLEGVQISCGLEIFSIYWKSKSYILYLVVGNFLLPLLILVFCYLNILLKVRKHAAAMMVINSNRQCKSDKDYKTTIKLIKMGINVTVAFILAWSPYAIITMLGICDFLKEATSLILVTICGFFAKSFTMYNPIIYIFSYPKFKKELMKLLLPWRRKHQKHIAGMRTMWYTQQSCRLERSLTIKISKKESDHSKSEEVLERSYSREAHDDSPCPLEENAVEIQWIRVTQV